MIYFKNSELAEIYHVSVRTVLNWIEEAKEGKLELELYKRGDRYYVSNTTRNISIIEQIVERRKKYRNKRGYRVVSPKQDFYKLFTKHQLIDIIQSLDLYHEVPRQYNYFDGGADRWDKYAWRLAAESTPNLLNQTVRQLEMNQSYLDQVLAPFKRVNIVDIGVGNALPVKAFLERLLARGVLGRYIALDISPKILELAKENIESWFDGRVAFEGHQLDISYDRFVDFMAEDYDTEGADDTINLILCFGGTLNNLRNPELALKVIQSSMIGRNDLFLQTLKLDTIGSRRYFDFNIKPGLATLSPNHRLIFDLMNVDESFYEVEMGFSDQSNMRYIHVRLKVALSIVFEFDGSKRVINLNKNDTILLWRYWHYRDLDMINLLDKSGFNIVQISQTEDHEYILTVSQVTSASS